MPVRNCAPGAVAFLAACALLSLYTSARADDAKPFLHPLFTDNMVLQRGVADPVWGWTTPGQTVTVSMAGKTAQAVAGPDGKWLAKVGPFPAGGPYTLTVHWAADGDALQRPGRRRVALHRAVQHGVRRRQRHGCRQRDRGGELPEHPSADGLAARPPTTPQQTFTGPPGRPVRPDQIVKSGTGGNTAASTASAPSATFSGETCSKTCTSPSA